MPDLSPQIQFLELVKQKQPTHASWADRLAELLNISRDGAYRRIRGQVSLSFDEAKLLSEMFQVSIDQLSNGNSQFLVFKHLILNHTPQTFETWLTTMHSNLKMLSNYGGSKELSFTAKDIPIFHYFQYPYLSAFKMFFWMKSLLNYDEYKQQEYSHDTVPEKYLKLGKTIYQIYSNIPAAEIWADETTNVTLKQLQFYQDSGFFKSKKDIELILDDYQELINSVRHDTSEGKRSNGTGFSLYKNEILIADNTVLFKMDEKRVTFVSHNITELLMTTDQNFCEQTERFIHNLQNRSIMISKTGERERNKFFNEINTKIAQTKAKLLG
jgi:hypothetical protein